LEKPHGTECFYRHRAEITKRLIQEKGFTIVGLEADWPDTARVNQYVRGAGKDSNAIQSLSDYKRFPTWMWKNEIVADFVEWLKEYNAKQETDQMVGIHGLDVYSQENSQKEVLEKLRAEYPSLLSTAETAYLHSKSLWGEIDPKAAKKVVHEV
jgi:erythromycin esterase-like protein